MTGFAVERRALARRLFDDSTAALELIDVYAGDRLGLYATLARHEDLSATELAHETGVEATYVRQWLDHQATAGFIAASGGHAEAARYRLPGPHRHLLTGPHRHALWIPVALVLAVARTVPHPLAPPQGPSHHR